MTTQPPSAEDLARRLRTINPEAGRHGVPVREADMARAVRCSTAAWSRFPYLEMRYGERGQRFTNSDTCWLLTLYDLDEALVIGNLQWLRTILASRGLPTIILQDQLRSIDADVAADERERWHTSTAFRTMLERLDTERTSLLSQHRTEELVAHWQSRFGRCPGHSVPDAAALLISARVDTASGIDRAWDATRSWFIDPQNFSSEWIGVVNGLSDTLHGELST